MIDFRTEPSRYRHWKLLCGGAIATLAIDVDEGAGLDFLGKDGELEGEADAATEG